MTTAPMTAAPMTAAPAPAAPAPVAAALAPAAVLAPSVPTPALLAAPTAAVVPMPAAPTPAVPMPAAPMPAVPMPADVTPAVPTPDGVMLVMPADVPTTRTPAVPTPALPTPVDLCLSSVVHLGSSVVSGKSMFRHRHHAPRDKVIARALSFARRAVATYLITPAAARDASFAVSRSSSVRAPCQPPLPRTLLLRAIPLALYSTRKGVYRGNCARPSFVRTRRACFAALAPANEPHQHRLSLCFRRRRSFLARVQYD